MRILFVVDSLSIQCGANVNIARTLAKHFKRNGHTIEVLAKDDCKRPISKRIAKEFDKVYQLNTDKIGIWKSKELEEDFNKAKQVLWLLLHPGILFLTLDRIYFENYFSKKVYKLNIEKICEKNKFDVVMGFPAPYYIAEAIAASKIDAIKTIYQLDPFTNNYTLLKKKQDSRRRIENATLQALDIAFMVDFVKKDIIKQNIVTDTSRLIVANLPGIIVDNLKVVNGEAKSVKISEITFCFAGKFYEDIRNPQYLLELFLRLPGEYRLHLAGSGCEKIITQYKEKLGNRLILHGYLNKASTLKLLSQADVLVNVDNTIKNQMPSKILEYICQGKKTLNICQDKDCLSVGLLKKYPNGLSVFTDEKNMNSNISRIKEFVVKPYFPYTKEQILKDYKEYTDLYVAEEISDALEEKLKMG